MRVFSEVCVVNYFSNFIQDALVLIIVVILHELDRLRLRVGDGSRKTRLRFVNPFLRPVNLDAPLLLPRGTKLVHSDLRSRIGFDAEDIFPLRANAAQRSDPAPRSRLRLPPSAFHELIAE